MPAMTKRRKGQEMSMVTELCDGVPAGPPPEEASPGPLPDDVHFVVVYEDEAYWFRPETVARFGRDDEECQIPIWSEINRRALSRVAGALWMVGGQMWLRNLSESHELVVRGDSRPFTLPRRVHDDDGFACSLPRNARITGPLVGGVQPWCVTVQAVRDAPPSLRGHKSASERDPQTDLAPPIPMHLRDTAIELCAPILLEGGEPATYQKIAVALNISKPQARDRVTRLVEYYAGYLGAGDPLDAANEPDRQLSRVDRGQLSPTYAPCAHLLVERMLVRRADVEARRADRSRALPG